MNNTVNRREFGGGSAAFLGGLLLVTVTRMGPRQGDRKIKEHQFSKLRPDDTEYWQKRGDKTLGIGHVFKYPYAYYDLLARAKDPKLEEKFDAKAWRLF